MIPTRRTQPYRGTTPNMPGMALMAMLKGRGTLPNPQDVQRKAQRRRKPTSPLIAAMLQRR